MKNYRVHADTPARTPGTRASAKRAFTMIEMIVVVGLILLLSAVAVPSFVQLFSSGASAQAYNMVSAQLMAARNVAIDRGQYAGLHFQRPDASTGSFRMIRGDYSYFSYCGVVIGTYNVAAKSITLDMASGYDPKPMPGHMSLADLDQSTKTLATNNATDASSFTSGTILFNPSGSLVTRNTITTSLSTTSAFVAPQTTAIWTNLASASRVFNPCINPVLLSLDEYLLVYSSMSPGSQALTDFLNGHTENVMLNYNTGLLMQRK